MGEFPSGQRGQTVNLLLFSFGGSNPPSPTKTRDLSIAKVSCLVKGGFEPKAAPSRKQPCGLFLGAGAAAAAYGQKHSRLTRLERFVILLVSSCSMPLLYLPQAAHEHEPERFRSRKCVESTLSHRRAFTLSRGRQSSNPPSPVLYLSFVYLFYIIFIPIKLDFNFV